ncbi:MAG: DMT family transporter [Alphaproteobacteria bacterium]
MNRSAVLAAAALLVAALLWSSGTVLVRALRESVPPMGLTFWRSVVAFVAVLPFALPGLRSQWKLARREALRLVAAGLTGVALFPIVLFAAIHRTEALNVGLISASEPLVIALIAWLALGHRLGAGQVVGFVIGAAGVALIAAQGEIARLAVLTLGLGDAFVIASLYVWAVYTVLVQRLPRELGAPVVLLAVFASGIVFALPFALVEARHQPIAPTPEAITVVLYSAIFGTLLAFGCWNFGARVLGPGRAGYFLYVIPVFTTALSVGLLGEPLRGYHGVGAAAIALGLAFATVPFARLARLTTPVRRPKPRPRGKRDRGEAS